MSESAVNASCRTSTGSRKKKDSPASDSDSEASSDFLEVHGLWGRLNAKNILTLGGTDLKFPQSVSHTPKLCSQNICWCVDLSLIFQWLFQAAPASPGVCCAGAKHSAAAGSRRYSGAQQVGIIELSSEGHLSDCFLVIVGLRSFDGMLVWASTVSDCSGRTASKNTQVT